LSESAFQEVNGALQATQRFPDYASAFAFVASLAFLAEKLNHHPEVRWNFRTVEVRLSTHDAGGVVTEKDHQLARAIDAVLALKS
jgi:4a-hydroxytetrahydrobiopterin dehydratase